MLSWGGTRLPTIDFRGSLGISGYAANPASELLFWTTERVVNFD
jgi:hypothetical protein